MSVSRLTDRSVRSITASLQEFGYSALTTAEVRATADKLLAGEAVDPGDIIAMFIDRMLRDAGALPERPLHPETPAIDVEDG